MATHASAFPQIAIIMLAVTYGLQVSVAWSFFVYVLLMCWLGDYLYHQERVHARWLDDCLSSFVRFLRSPIEAILCLTTLSDIRSTASSSRYIPSGAWMSLVGVTLAW